MLRSLLAFGSAVAVAAHGGVLEYQIGGTYYRGFRPYNTPTGQTSTQRQWATYDPVWDVTSEYMACNNPSTILDEQLTATVAAGASITAFWNDWPHSVGPMMVYMADCGGDCTRAEPTFLDWFKIDEAGLLPGRCAVFGNVVMERNNSWTDVDDRLGRSFRIR